MSECETAEPGADARPRPSRDLTARITADGSSGWPVEPDRYRLVAARACPWAHRAVIARRLLGLEDAIGLAMAGPLHDERSWEFHLDPGGRDPVLGVTHLREAFERAVPGYAGGVSVPAIVDVPTGEVVTNDHARIPLDLCTEWGAHHRDGAPELYPDDRREEIDELDVLLAEIAIGPYRAGMAEDQDEYERECHALFAGLEALSERLVDQRFLLGERLTEPDLRLWPTLVRFDAVYHGHFKCNRRPLTAMPVLWAYARDLFQTPGFGDTVDFGQIQEHYYRVHRHINPTGVVPVGPDTRPWWQPHGRDGLGGRPFGEGSPPGPVRPAEAVPGPTGAPYGEAPR